MPDNVIEIDDLKFGLSEGSSFEYDGVHAIEVLSGIELGITVYSEADIQAIDDLLKKDTVKVNDPFVNREYQGKLGRKSSSYQSGVPGKHYNFEVKELDEAPVFEELEIEGQTFSVIVNKESSDSKGVIGLHILLRLSSDEFQKLRKIFQKSNPLTIRRIGIDQAPIAQSLRGVLYWSKHQDADAEFYKQQVNFYPVDSEPYKLDLAVGTIQRAHSRMILSLTARFEHLVGILVDKGQITSEAGKLLLAEDWEALIDDERNLVLRSELTEVEDAELEML